MRRTLAFGVFDLLHPGHLAFLKQARRLGYTNLKEAILFPTLRRKE